MADRVAGFSAGASGSAAGEPSGVIAGAVADGCKPQAGTASMRKMIARRLISVVEQGDHY
jgi:hypothetical protein